jgi:hypothetical protein
MKNIIKGILILLSGIFLSAPLLAQDGAFEEEGWKKRVASPTYGAVFGLLNFTDDEGNDLGSLTIPGIEFRIFNGTNVGKRGGFFVGYEVGTIIFLASDTETFPARYGGTDTEAKISELFVGTLFLMSKYGYRADLGIKAAGLSLGAELGMGIQMSMGGADLYYEDSGGTGYEPWVEVSFPFSLLLEAAGEATFRLGQNFRLFARAGAMVMPSFFDIDEGSTGLSNLDGEFLPIYPNLRVGFSLNY